MDLKNNAHDIAVPCDLFSMEKCYFIVVIFQFLTVKVVSYATVSKEN